MDRKLTLVVGAGIVLAATIALFEFHSAGTAALWNVSDSGRWLLPLVAVAALIDSVNPCAFSMTTRSFSGST